MDAVDMPDLVSVPSWCQHSNTKVDGRYCWHSADTAFIWSVHRCLPWFSSFAAFAVSMWAVSFNLLFLRSYAV